MPEPVDIDQTLEQLSRQQTELQFAFRELGELLGAALTGRAILDPKYVAAILDQLASDACDKLAKSCGEAATPDAHLLFIAAEVRKLCGMSSVTVEATE